MGFASNSRDNEAFFALAAPVSTGTGTALQTLAYVPLEKNQLRRAGMSLRVKAFGHTAANGNTKTVSLVIGPAALISAGATAPTQAQINTGAAAAGTAALTASASAAANNKDWFLEATIQRAGPLVQEALGTGNFNQTALNPVVTDLTQDETTALALYMTATDGTSSAGDVTLSGFYVEGLSD